jgi:hypothetical protein
MDYSNVEKLPSNVIGPGPARRPPGVTISIFWPISPCLAAPGPALHQHGLPDAYVG